MSNNKHKRNKAYAPKKPSYTPWTKEQKIRYGSITIAVIVVLIGLILWNKLAPWDGSLPMNREYNLTHTYPNKLITNLDNSSIVSHHKYYITGGVTGPVEGYHFDPESSIRSDKNTTDFMAYPDEGTDSPFRSYYITSNAKPYDELSASVYPQMSSMYEGYISELMDGNFGGQDCKYFIYRYDASHDEPEEGEETETDELTEEMTSELAECLVAYFPSYKNTSIIVQTPVNVDNDPEKFVDDQVMIDLLEKIVATIEFHQ